MPLIDAGEPTRGWACTCPAFRLGEPTPEQAIKALARSSTVTVEYQGEQGGYRRFTAWTDPDSRYQVAMGLGSGGWCKHITACIIQAELLQCAIGANYLLTRVAELEKENRKLRKDIEKCKMMNNS